MDELETDSAVFSVDRIDLTEVEIRVRREDERTWRWAVLYVGTVQVQGVTHEGESAAFQRAQQHRYLWLEQELDAIKRQTEENDGTT